MKTLLVFLLFTSVSLSLAHELPDPVRDTDGNLVLSGTEYYMVPTFRPGGGPTLAPTRNESCPLDVVPDFLDNGLPLKFKPVDPKEDVIRESTDLNIIFSASSICIQSNVWMLEEYEGQLIVTAHGVSGNPGQETINNWFKIEKLRHQVYKIVFCPTVCDLCRPVCGDIGVQFDENGTKRFAISDWTFSTVFKKAEGIKAFLSSPQL